MGVKKNTIHCIKLLCKLSPSFWRFWPKWHNVKYQPPLTWVSFKRKCNKSCCYWCTGTCSTMKLIRASKTQICGYHFTFGLCSNPIGCRDNRRASLSIPRYIATFRNSSNAHGVDRCGVAVTVAVVRIVSASSCGPHKN